MQDNSLSQSIRYLAREERQYLQKNTKSLSNGVHTKKLSGKICMLEPYAFTHGNAKPANASPVDVLD